MISRHWELERRLRKEFFLLARKIVGKLERCYTILYRELWWLNKYAGTGSYMRRALYENLVKAAATQCFERR
jgi:hypothetical protein